MSSDVFAVLAFIDLLSRGQGAPGISPTPAIPQPSTLPGVIPGAVPSVVPPPAPHPIPPPGDIGPPPADVVLPPLDIPIPAPAVSPPPPDLPPPPAPPLPPAPPMPTAPPVPPGSLPPMPPWGSSTPTVPSTLPPFPGPGWVPDTPVTATVAARAAFWNPQLWDYPSKTIKKPYVQEQFGGQWLTFSAAWHPGDAGPQTYMSTEAWRLADAPPVAPPTPQPSAPVMPPPGDSSPLQRAAIAMADALTAHGYKQADQPLYRAFQAAAGLGADGFPGTGTMGKLAAALQAVGRPPPPVKVYPWHSAPGTTGYDGVNAPTWLEWSGQAAPAPIPVAPAPIPVAPAPAPAPISPAVIPASAPQPTPTTPVQQAADAMAHALAAHGYRQVDQPLYKAFQTAAGLGSDGFPGTGTMGHLQTVLASYGQGMPPVPIYPWHSAPGTTGYDGHNAPTWAQWTSTGTGTPA
jgi:hypothetical protein